MSIEIEVWSDYVCPFCLLAADQFREALETGRYTSAHQEARGSTGKWTSNWRFPRARL